MNEHISENSGADDPAVRTAYGKLAGKVGIVCNVLLCALKFIAGLISGSLSITADAVNNLSDASSSVISLIGFKLSEKTADREHPYGHGRYEYLAGFMVAALIIVIGFELLRDSILKIIDPTEIEFGLLPAAVLIGSVIAKLWLMLFYRRIARRINSETLRAAAADSRNDVFSTSSVLTALIISRFTGVNLDGVMGALVALFILISGAGLVKDAINPLLGKAPSAEDVEKIRAEILSYDGVLGTHDLMIHDYGPGRQFASAHVEVRADMPLVDCHELIDRIERGFLERGLNMLVHPDPVAEDDTTAGKLSAVLTAIVHSIDERITVHDIRAVGTPRIQKAVFDCVLPGGFEIPKHELREMITERLQESFPECRAVITFDDGYASIPKTSGDN